ncbi:MAG TPA: MlaD family protein, partial [Humisphaera sp.]
VVLAALLALGWMILRFSNSSMSDLLAKGTPFKIRSDRADGVSEGSPVLYLGVSVGRVTEVRRIQEEDRVEISAILNEGQTLPNNAVGRIRPQSALSPAAAIAFELPRPPAAAGTTAPAKPQRGPAIKAGDVLPAESTGGGLIPPEITELAASARALSDEAQRLRLVNNLNDTITATAKLMASADKLVGDPKIREDLLATLASIRQTAENLKQTTAKLDTLAGETAETLKQVRTTLADGSQKLELVSKQFDARMTQVGELLDHANAVATKIDKGDGTLGSLVNDPRLYGSMLDSSRELNLSIKGLRRLVEQWEQEGFTLKLK